MIINLAHRSLCPRFHARLIWQVLYNHYVFNGGDVSNLDNMLCDYDLLAKWIEEHNRDHPLDDEPLTIYWAFSGEMTEIGTTKVPYPSLTITYKYPEVKIC